MEVRLWVGGAALAASLVASPAVAQERLVHHELDHGTNAIVRVFKTPTGGRIELETPELTIMKSVAGSKVTTSMRDSGGGRDSLLLVFDEKSIAVTTPAGSVKAARSDSNRLATVRKLVTGSGVGRRAAALIGQLGLGQGTPIQPMLLTTRVFILAAAGKDARGEISAWARAAKRSLGSRPFIVKAGWSAQDKGMTPTDCWNAYAKEAIAAFIEWEDCMRDHSAWWDVFGRAGCDVVYDMRALGAFSWWLKCTALA